MSVPVSWNDDDFYIVETLREAANAVREDCAKRELLDEAADVLSRHSGEPYDELVMRCRLAADDGPIEGGDYNPDPESKEIDFMEDENLAALTQEEREALKAFFTYHAPTEEDKNRYAAINAVALHFATVVMAQCPKGPDRSAAVRMIREARMTANAAIACRGAKLPY